MLKIKNYEHFWNSICWENTSNRMMVFCTKKWKPHCISDSREKNVWEAKCELWTFSNLMYDSRKWYSSFRCVATFSRLYHFFFIVILPGTNWQKTICTTVKVKNAERIYGSGIQWYLQIDDVEWNSHLF